MVIVNKFLKLSFVFLILTSLLVFTVTPTTVQAASNPSVPQFSLKIASHPYDVAPTYTINPYTGETIVATEGYHVENKTVEVTIKNQLFSSYKTSEGNYVNLCYNISVKPHYNDKWLYYPVMYSQIPLIAVKGDYTVTAFGPNAHTYVNGETKTEPHYFSMDLPDNGQLDFRVEALTGYYTSSPAYYGVPGGPYYEYTFFGESSGWSKIQTITINASSTATNSAPSITTDGNSQSPDPYATQSPDFIFTIPFFALVMGVLLGGVVVAAVMVVIRRHIKTANCQQLSTDYTCQGRYFSYV